MDSRLQERLTRWHEQICALKDIDERFLVLDASYKSFFAEIMLKQDGSSVAAKEAKAYASPEWKEFAHGHALAQSELNHAKRMLELKQKAYDAEHVTYKIENEGINRQ